jgi:hypothetical protein
MDDYPCNLGAYTRKITTASPAAQVWFDRGLNWCFGFHHEEAIYCFEAALAADPDCAMAHWGIAYGVGPNYNFPWEMRDPDTIAWRLSVLPSPPLIVVTIHHASILTSKLLSYSVPCSQNRIGSPGWARSRSTESAKRKPVVLAGSKPEISSCVMRSSLG